MKNYIIEIAVLSLLLTSNIIYPNALINCKTNPKSFYNAETRKGIDSRLFFNPNLINKISKHSEINSIEKIQQIYEPVVILSYRGSEVSAIMELIYTDKNILSFPKRDFNYLCRL